MKCANHAEVESVAYCAYCGRPLCNECKKDVRGTAYCESCLVARLQPGFPFAAVGTSGAGSSPGVALALGFIPGVGAIYNGQVLKAIIQVLIFGSLIAVADRVSGPMDTMFGLGAAAFYFYMVIDSFQTAKRKALGQPTEEWLGLGEFKMDAPVGAGLLIGLGALFMLDNMGVPVFRHLGKFWPILLILIGVVLLQRRMKESRPAPPASPVPPSAPKEGPDGFPGPQGM